MGKEWSNERRAKQAERIREWRPWDRATGPRTDVGKARSSKNAFRGNTRALLRELAKLLR